MYHRVREAKYRLETVTFIWDFREHINPGDTIIGLPSVEVLVSSGVDADPSLLILGSPVVIEGTIVEQRIHRGIPGTIYTITITVSTAQGDTFEDVAYLAILPFPYIAFKFFLETMVYPIEMYYEGLLTTVKLSSGRFFNTVVMVPEGIVSTLTITSGTLSGHPVNYTMTVLGGGTNGNEAIQSFITLINGVIFGGSTAYVMPFESLQVMITLVDGTLFGDPLNYAMTTEALNSYITLISGILA